MTTGFKRHVAVYNTFEHFTRIPLSFWRLSRNVSSRVLNFEYFLRTLLSPKGSFNDKDEILSTLLICFSPA